MSYVKTKCSNLQNNDEVLFIEPNNNLNNLLFGSVESIIEEKKMVVINHINTVYITPFQNVLTLKGKGIGDIDILPE